MGYRKTRPPARYNPRGLRLRVRKRPPLSDSHAALRRPYRRGFLKKKLGSQRAPMDGVCYDAFLEALKAHASLSACRLHRIYYYDAPPLEDLLSEPLGGGGGNLATTDLSRQNKALLGRPRETPFVSLRLGELAFRGWRLSKRRLSDNSATTAAIVVRAADLQPDIQQKGVDMRIGLDIASLTLKRHVDIVVLVTGDSNLIPAMKFARREGARLFLAPLGHGIKPGFKEHADLNWTTLSRPNFPRKCRQSHSQPSIPSRPK